MYYVYILQNEKGRIYIGCTRDLKKRIQAHQNSKARATHGHKWELVYYEAYRAEADAWIREKHLKRSGQARRALKGRIRNSMAELGQ